VAVSRADKITETLFTPQTYSDFADNFTVHPVTNELVVLKNAESVKQAFKNLILTNVGERFFSPFFGSNINRSLFENFTPFLREDIIRYVRTAATQFEPRVNLLNVTVTQDPTNDNYISVNIVFSMINTSEPISFSIFVKRVR